jgi:hypothetical protein
LLVAGLLSAIAALGKLWGRIKSRPNTARANPPIVMAGLVPAIHDFLPSCPTATAEQQEIRGWPAQGRP